MNTGKERLWSTSLCRLWLVALVLLCCSGCVEKDTRVTFDNSNPLRFILSGRATLEYLEVTGPDLERDGANRQGNKGDYLPVTKVYWRLAPGATAINQPIDKLGPITYGTVPQGLIQVYPEHDKPSPLIEGDLYNIRVSANDAHGVNMFFVIRNGKIVTEGN